MSLALQRSIMIARKKEWPDNTLDNLSTRSLLYSGEQLDNRKSIYRVTEKAASLLPSSSSSLSLFVEKTNQSIANERPATYAIGPSF